MNNEVLGCNPMAKPKSSSAILPGSLVWYFYDKEPEQFIVSGIEHKYGRTTYDLFPVGVTIPPKGNEYYRTVIRTSRSTIFNKKVNCYKYKLKRVINTLKSKEQYLMITSKHFELAKTDHLETKTSIEALQRKVEEYATNGSKK